MSVEFGAAECVSDTPLRVTPTRRFQDILGVGKTKVSSKGWLTLFRGVQRTQSETLKASV